MNQKLTNLKTKLDNHLAEIKKIQNEIFDDIKASLFSENPELKSFGFVGYTPSFNDGDPCVFISTFNAPIVNGYDSNTCEFDDEKEPTAEETKKLKKLANVVSEHLKLLPKEYYGSVFGENGFKVIFTPNKTEVEDYDCGY